MICTYITQRLNVCYIWSRYLKWNLQQKKEEAGKIFSQVTGQADAKEVKEMGRN